jgi:NDP-sugar pyrophosphorylase family protein
MENQNIKAMILAAGLGTRLLPLTGTMPKALVKYHGRTLLEGAINHLAVHGIRKIIVNVHHFASQVIEYLAVNRNFGLDIVVSDESDELLDTGGGIKKAEWFLNDSSAFLVRNVDVISDMDLKKIAAGHLASGALATLAVRERITSRYFLFDQGDRLCGWTNTKTGEQILAVSGEKELKRLAFSGIQVLDPSVFKLMPEGGRFSITEYYLKLAGSHLIQAYLDNDSEWKDAGKNPEEMG